MRTSIASCSPLAGLSPAHKMALGSVLAVVGGTTITLSLLLGWYELARPWSLLLGFAGGLAGGVGAALAVCGLVRYARG